MVQRLRLYFLVCAFSCFYMLATALPAKAQDPFIGEIKMFAGNFAPRGWALCDGQLLPISQYQALFSILGTTYGGDGETTFALPDLRGRVPIHPGNGPGVDSVRLGQKGGSNKNTITVNNLPAHSHNIQTSQEKAAVRSPAGNVLAESWPKPIYNKPTGTLSNAKPTTSVGGNQAVNNMQPYLSVNYIIALNGVYPSE